MTLPEPTYELLQRLKRAALLLDALAAQAKGDRAFRAANDAANTVWCAMRRIEDLAGVVEDMAPAFDREPHDAARHG